MTARDITTMFTILLRTNYGYRYRRNLTVATRVPTVTLNDQVCNDM